LRKTHSNKVQYEDFTFEYLYTNSEPIALGGVYGSVIYIRVDSTVHESVYMLPVDTKSIQDSINEHQKNFNNLPSNLSKETTKWLYFNMGTKFRIT
jgi:hypothetical protein